MEIYRGRCKQSSRILLSYNLLMAVLVASFYTTFFLECFPDVEYLPEPFNLKVKEVLVQQQQHLVILDFSCIILRAVILDTFLLDRPNLFP